MARSLSMEQDRAASPGQGIRGVVANAGSGKTTTGGEWFRRLFLLERKRRFPDRSQLSADEVGEILRLFFLTSYTVKQAADLDAKVKSILREEGFPIPTSDGIEERICRTMDSHIGRMLRKRRFFRAWSGIKDAWPTFFARLFERLPGDTQASLSLGKNGETLDGRERLLNFFYRYSPVLLGDMQTMIAESIIRVREGPKLPMVLTPRSMVNGIIEILSTARISDAKWGNSYWDGLVAVWRKDRDFHSDLYHNLERHGLNKDRSQRDADKKLASLWNSSAAVADRFLNLYQIAKTRGYHPLFNPKYLGSQAFLEAFASADGLEGESVASFHAWATAYDQLKLDSGLRDFADCLEAVVRVLAHDHELLRILRPKYCLYDESQDFTTRVNRLVDLFAPPEGRKGMTLLLGDGKQSLYVFAGANPYEFARRIKGLRAEGDNVYTLTKSFRSARRIVNLGNEIASTLPSYASTVVPSVPDYHQDGELNVSPPLSGEDEEATWILSRIDALLKAGETSIMIVFRNDPRTHPISYLLKDPKYRSVDLLTIHRSKGLEAKHVFVGGCTSGRFPLPIGDSLGKSFEEKQEATAAGQRRLFNDQECNIIYVAATRAAWSLTFSIPVMMKVSTGMGDSRDEKNGPSPIFWELPTLKKLCLESGWKESDLREGVSVHEKKVDIFYQRFHGRIWALNEEAKNLGLKPGSLVEIKDRDDVTALGIHQMLREEGGNRAYEATPRKPVSSSTPALRESVLSRCRTAFFSASGKPPKGLPVAERDLAFQEGWLELGGTGELRFTDTFKMKFRAS